MEIEKQHKDSFFSTWRLTQHEENRFVVQKMHFVSMLGSILKASANASKAKRLAHLRVFLLLEEEKTKIE